MQFMLSVYQLTRKTGWLWIPQYQKSSINNRKKFIMSKPDISYMNGPQA